MFVFSSAFSQLQSCPANINFSAGSLTHWFAYTGNNKNGNGPTAIKDTFSSYLPAPTGTIGTTIIYEYQLPSVPGISVNTTGGTDTYGGFSKIPTINGYQYDYSILLGSTSITRSNTNGDGGGYIRGISYNINVPAGPTTVPYTMTYAYAMVLENGQHNSDEQPLISATLKTQDSVISCASPAYYLPTLNNATREGSGATLDTAGALKEGFAPSNVPSPNPDPNSASPNAAHLYDVWAKGWTEVTFDLSPYRGQLVTLTFEADNCVPGGHFAYAYIALRNTCAGLIISGDSTACNNGNLTYSVPALASANYQWAVPNTWTIVSGNNTNVITVSVGNQGGVITAQEQNSCADLQATIPVTTVAPPVGGNVNGNATVCTGNNSSTLLVTGQTGNVIEWVSSTDGINWASIPDITNKYIAQNLTSTTQYKAVIQTNAACPSDSGMAATITVDPKSVGGVIPANSNFCAGQDRGSVLTLTNNIGSVVNWQSSQDSINWVNFNPIDTNTVYKVTGLTSSTFYRIIVKSGVCITDTSSVASIKLYTTPYPKAVVSPLDTSICYNGTAQLNAVINIGTNYTWTNYGSLNNQGDGMISSTPYSITAAATPLATANYVLSIENLGCPNFLMDTFRVIVVPQFTVSAGNDTSVVVNQPLQLQATSTDITSDTYTWSPSGNLDNPDISDPVATFGAGVTTATYTVTGVDSTGCHASDTLNIKIYNVPPGLYVPTAFTPNGDGLNDIFKPILIGMKSLTLFRVYNRWGQLVFSTSNASIGWDGTFKGIQQNSGSYVWIADGISYEGVNIQQKGNVVLIR